MRPPRWGRKVKKYKIKFCSIAYLASHVRDAGQAQEDLVVLQLAAVAAAAAVVLRAVRVHVARLDLKQSRAGFNARDLCIYTKHKFHSATRLETILSLSCN
jgi:hypothetical protein